MESTYIEVIEKRSGNIGSLCFFLGKNKEVLDFIDSKIPKEVWDRTISEKVYSLDIPKIWDCGVMKFNYIKICT